MRRSRDSILRIACCSGICCASWRHVVKAVLYISHVLELVEKVCDHIVVIHKGRIDGGRSVSTLANPAAAAEPGGVFTELIQQDDLGIASAPRSGRRCTVNTPFELLFKLFRNRFLAKRHGVAGRRIPNQHLFKCWGFGCRRDCCRLLCDARNS